MIDFTLDNLTAVLTPATVVGVAIAGLVLALFLWCILARVQVANILDILFAGLAFMVFMAASRYLDPVAAWEKWLGAALLWVEYASVAGLSVWTWRRWRGRKHP